MESVENSSDCFDRATSSQPYSSLSGFWLVQETQSDKGALFAHFRSVQHNGARVSADINL